MIFTWYHKDGDNQGFDESYDGADEAHEQIEIEIKVEEDVERAKVVDGKRAWFAVEEDHLGRDHVYYLLDHEDTNHGHNFKQQLAPNVIRQEEPHEKYDKAHKQQHEVNYKVAPYQVTNQIA